MSRPICQICGGADLNRYRSGRGDDDPGCRSCDANSRPRSAVTVTLGPIWPPTTDTKSPAPLEPWTQRDTHNAEIESAGGADLQMARAVAHIKALETRIETLEQALRRARLHGLHNARRPSFPDAQRLGDWIDAGCVGQPPEIMARFVLDAIDERGGL